MNRKIIWMIVLALLILSCAIWSSFKIETFEGNEFLPAEIKSHYNSLLNSKHSSYYMPGEKDIGYIPRLIIHNNNRNSIQSEVLDNESIVMDIMENKLKGMTEQPKYYNGTKPNPITSEDPLGALRPRKETLKTNEFYD
jgi:hypothetical protein